ncbi:MAG: hypothetical protein J6Z12_06615 [Paludibacteraceae bacterium]|nr:hypothetical protein [Paludibacteraceae bacterium]
MRKIGIFLTCVLALAGCRHRTRFYTDVSGEPVAVVFDRFDRDIFTLDSSALTAKYGAFVDLYLWQVMGLKSYSMVPFFLKDTSVQALDRDIEKVYPDLEAAERELTTAFQYWRHYFPERAVPRLITHFSGYNQSLVAGDGVLSVSLDCYLGSDYAAYQGGVDGIYTYMLPYMTPRQLPQDVMLGFLMTELPEPMPGSNLLEYMIYYGKLMYLLEVAFPEREPSELLSYTPEQYQWACRHERQVWNYLAEQNLLFASDRLTISHFTQWAPFTTGLSQDSPGRMAWFTGLRIVESYMDNNRQLGLPDLVSEQDVQKILQMSGYRP